MLENVTYKACDAIKAPLNDLSFVNDLVKFSIRNVAESAVSAMKRHLWYLAEELASLALFNERISDEKKVLMKTNLRSSGGRKESKEAGFQNI